MALHPELRQLGYRGLPTDAPLVVSYGMGVDSTAILVRFAREGIRPDMIIFADTGCEKAVTYRFLEQARGWISSVWPSLELTVLPYSNREGCLQTLIQYLLRTEQLPGTAYGTRSCSVKYKGGRIDALVDRTYGRKQEYYRAGGQVIRVLGYDAGPADLERRARDQEAQQAKREKYESITLPQSKIRYRNKITERVQEIRNQWSDLTFYLIDQEGMKLSPDARRDLETSQMRKLTRTQLHGLLERDDDQAFDSVTRLAARGFIETEGRRGSVLREPKAWIARDYAIPVSAADKYVWWYPLYDWKWDRDQCIEEIERTKQRGSTVPSLDVPPKSACYICSHNKTFEFLSMVLCEPDEAYNVLLIEALGLAPEDEEQTYACTAQGCDWEGTEDEAEGQDGKLVCPECGAKLKKKAKKTSEGIWRKEHPGTAGGIAAPASMSQYILEWMRDGRAYDRLPPGARGEHGLTLREMARLPHVGRVYLPVLEGQGKDQAALAELRRTGMAVAESIYRRASADGLLVDGRAVRLEDNEKDRNRVAAAARRVRNKLYGKKVCGPVLPERLQLKREVDSACSPDGSEEKACSRRPECDVQPLPPPGRPPPPAPPVGLPGILGGVFSPPPPAPSRPLAGSLPSMPGRERYVVERGLYWTVFDSVLRILMPGIYSTEAEARQAAADLNALARSR